MGNSQLVVALSHSGRSLTSHLRKVGVEAVSEETLADPEIAVDIICHDARTCDDDDACTALGKLLKAHPGAELLVVIEQHKGLHLPVLPSSHSLHVLTTEELNAGELVCIFGSPSLRKKLNHEPSEQKVLSSLNSVTSQLSNERLQEQVMQNALSEIMSITSADFAAFYKPEGLGQTMVPMLTEGRPLVWPGGRYFDSSNLIASACSSKLMHKAEYVQDVGLDQNECRELAQECVVPLIGNNGLLGVVQVAFQYPWSQFEQVCEELQQFTTIASVALQNESLLNQAQLELERTKAASELSNYLHATSDLEEIQQRISCWLLDHMDAESAAVVLIDQQQQVVGCKRYKSGATGPELVDFAEIRYLSQTVFQESIDRKELTVLPRGVKDPRESDGMYRLREQQGLGAVLCFPLMEQSDVCGLVIVQRHNRSADFTEKEISLLHTLCNQLSVSIHRESLLSEVAYKAYNDPVTQLPNRHYFEKCLKEKLSGMNPIADRLALLLLDLDQFKAVNETRGHEVGDRLLGMLAERLQKHVRSDDSLARFAGDEFVVLVQEVDGINTPVEVANRLLTAFEEPFYIDGGVVRLCAWVGVSIYPEHGKISEDLLKHASIAKQAAKERQLKEVTVFDEQLASVYRRRIEISGQLQDALYENQFELLYQPKVCMHSHRVIGVEALLRWNHPELGVVSPADFVPVAEKSGLITRIGSWVINEACRQSALWKLQGLSDLSMAVNIAAQQFAADDFVDETLKCAARFNLDPSALELEVTESVVMRDIDVVAKKLLSLRQANIKVAIDDFGTGYSSLCYLQDLPLDVLKIDRSFVMRLENNSDSTVAHSIAALAHSLGLATVAEGVETEQQLAKVCELNVDMVQGYYYSKPQRAEDIPAQVQRIGRTENSVGITLP
ncbi:MAG: EAL domain-containing protein [Gammaproteobacteria bacterium]|nr:EAL domain-containing protein [Gammaproteobacteria bacterium]